MKIFALLSLLLWPIGARAAPTSTRDFAAAKSVVSAPEMPFHQEIRLNRKRQFQWLTCRQTSRAIRARYVRDIGAVPALPASDVGRWDQTLVRVTLRRLLPF